MKCPMCNGKGYCFVSEAWGEADIVCEQCHGKGELDENGKPIITNEEWLRNANDEELCELLLKIAFMCAACGVSVFEKRHSCIVDDECLAIKNGYCMYCSATKTMEWLKQPHKE